MIERLTKRMVALFHARGLKGLFCRLLLPLWWIPWLIFWLVACLFFGILWCIYWLWEGKIFRE